MWKVSRKALTLASALLAFSGCGPNASSPIQKVGTNPNLGSSTPSRPFILNAGIAFHEIPSGTYTIGSPVGELERGSNESIREVTIAAPLMMSRTEISRKQYWQVVDASHTVSDDEANLPMVNLTWDEAVDFCKKLTLANPGNVYRLPKEEEWEIACRAGSSNMFGVWAADRDLEQALQKYNEGDKGFLDRTAQRIFIFNQNSPKPVDQGLENPWGFQNMHGNVWEWCDTGANDPTFYDKPIRGGAFSSPSYFDCRAARRAWGKQNQKKASIGFRIVVEPTS